MDDAPPTPAARSVREKPAGEKPAGGRLTVWGGGALYLLALTLAVGDTQASPAVPRALALLAATGLLVRLLRRTPLTALVLAQAGTALAVALSHNVTQIRLVPLLGVDIALAHLVAARPRRQTTPAVAVSGVLQLLLVAGFSQGQTVVTNTLLAVLALATACTVGLLLRERGEHAVALREQEVAEAVTAERLRIARELHDMVAHSIGVIALQAGMGSRVIDTRPEEARESLRAIEATSRDTLAGLRRTLVALRQTDPGSGPLGPTPALADLDRLAAGTADAGVRVELRRTGEVRALPAELELAAFRIVQEALTNVVRHAGTGDCWVTVDYGGEALSVEVVDDGRGTEPSGQGFGLVGMGERVALLHGRFSAGPQPAGGFRVAAELPLPVEAVAR